MILESILDNLTPVPILHLPSEGGCAEIYVALLHTLPLGSHKILAAKAMIDYAEQNHDITEKTVFVDQSSGNAAAAEALVCATRGYNYECFMPENMAPEKIQQVLALGGKIHFTPPKEFVDGAKRRAEAYCEEEPHTRIYLDQSKNPASPRAYEPIGRQFINSFPSIDSFVSGGGTYGTITGISRVLKNNDKCIQVTCAESVYAPRIHSQRNRYEMPEFTGQKITGFGGEVLQGNAQPDLYDNIVLTDEETAIQHIRELHKAGLLVGKSSAAVLHVAREVARKLGTGKTVVTNTYDSFSKMISENIY
jgi:cysteine synthase